MIRRLIPILLLLLGGPAGAGYYTEDGAVRIISGNHGMQPILEKFDALFEATHPGVKFKLEFNRLGNSINVASIAYGMTLLAPMGRQAMPAEMLAFRQAVGADPLVIRFAHGTVVSQDKAAPLAIYVNKANPLDNVTMAQLERIFTQGAAGGDLTDWEQLGAGKGAIHTYGTPEISGFGSFLLAEKMHGRSFRQDYEAFPLAAQIVRRVGQDAGGIGVAALGFLTPDVKLLSIDGSAGGAEDIVNGRYPLDRYIYFYLRDANDALAKDYVALVLSPAGQKIIAEEENGFLPLNQAEIAEEARKLQMPGPPLDKPYAPEAGSISIVGDDLMRPVIERLNALFHVEHGDARFSIALKGASTGISGLTAGVSALAPMAREARPVETEPFKRLTGYDPTDIHIGRSVRNPPAVYVNAANPLTRLDLGQVLRIFSSGELSRWEQLGWKPRNIHLYGPRDDGGWASTLLKDRPFARHYEGVADPIAAVAEDRYGIALAEQGTMPKGVRRLLPLPQTLRFYINRPATDPLILDYLGLALSAKGQAAIRELGYLPLDPDEIAGELAKLGRD